MSDARAELEAAIRHLASFPRPSASVGERRAAEWIAGRLRAEGCDARVEVERAHGTYWWPLGLVNGAAALAALAAARRPRSRGRRLLAAAVGGVGAAAVWDDLGGGRQWFRRPLQGRATYNVVAEAGDRDAERTAVLVSHHDAAHGGAVFSPKIPQWVYDRRPELFESHDRHLPIMYGVFLGPALAALGGLTGRRGPLRAAAVFGAGATAVMIDIGRSPVCPGANDNLSAVGAILHLARRLREEPVRGLKVLLVSTGSEESFMEGMQGFVARHGAALPRETTEMLCLESIGSPEALVIEGEGMLRMRMYPTASRDALAAAAEAAGVPVLRNLKTVLATDALVALRAGYRIATLASVNEVKLPSNYHSPHDTPDNLNWDTVLDCARVAETWVRRTAPAA